MAAMGRKPHPSVIRDLRGNPTKRPIPTDEIHLPARIPDPPANLSEEAFPYWVETANKLSVMGVLTEVDGGALALFAEVEATFWEAVSEVRKHGAVVEVGESGHCQASPWQTVMMQSQKQMRDWMAEFGMTPSSRTRVRPAGGAAPGNKLSGRGKRPG